MISIKNIFKTYRNGLSYFSHFSGTFSLTIDEGEFVSIPGTFRRRENNLDEYHWND